MDWRTTGTLEFTEGQGESFTFIPTQAGGVGNISAHNGSGLTAETGLITVAYVPPRISVSPSLLLDTQPSGDIITHELTLSNTGALTLSFEIVPNGLTTTHVQPFEVTYEWDDLFFIDRDASSGEVFWDYYSTPEREDPRVAGGTAEVTEVELQSSGINLGEWVNWDWELHLSNEGIDLPAGQLWATDVDPVKGYTRTAPCQFTLTYGEEPDASPYLFQVNHSLVTSDTTAVPSYGRVKRSSCAPMAITEGLHAQVFFWTGDSRSWIQYDGVRLVVSGYVTRTYPLTGWLTVEPVSGTLPPEVSQVIRAVIDLQALPSGDNSSAIVIQSNDPDNPVSVIPVTLTVRRLFLPIVMRDGDFQ
jgi:hypothetical protein